MYPCVFRTLPLLASVALFAAACSNGPTAPAAAPEAVLSSQAAKPLAAGQGSSPYACFTSVATPGGPHKYRYGRLNLPFSKGELAADGATLRYGHRVYAEDGSILRLANCIIPATPAAVQAMNRRFGLQGKAMSKRKSGGSEGGTIGIQACVTVIWPDGEEITECGDDPAPAPDDPYTCVQHCTPGVDEGGGPGGGGTPPGGDDPCADCEPEYPVVTENDHVDDDVPPPDCNNPAGWDPRFVRHFTAYCSGEPPTGERLTRTNLAVDRIAQRGPECAKIARRARELIAAGTFRYYKNEGYGFGGVSQKGQGWLAIDDTRVDYAKNEYYQSVLDRDIVHEVDLSSGISFLVSPTMRVTC